MILAELLQSSIEANASDLHLLCDHKPAIRVDGEILPLDVQAMTGKQIESICYQITSEQQKQTFQAQKELDFGFTIENLGSFRANYYMQNGTLAAAFRILPSSIPDINTLDFTQTITNICQKGSGLILLTGATGSGKSTTIASIVEYINNNYAKHIVTIEDPIEFRYKNNKSIISQRCIGEDTESFSTALKHLLRQDPDVIVIGEIRDYATMKTAMMAAESGHLVISTLHSNSTLQTLTRIVSLFPTEEQDNARAQLSIVLSCVVSQHLVGKKSGGRVLASELLLNTPAISNLIRDNKISQIYSQMQLNQSKTQMHTLEQSLNGLVKSGIIEQEIITKFAF